MGVNSKDVRSCRAISKDFLRSQIGLVVQKLLKLNILLILGLVDAPNESKFA